MFGIDDALIAAVAAPVIGGMFDFAGGSQANSANAAMAAQNRQFQADMSGTAHQREVADLRAAGLNPILSATGGAGSSTPGGATATMQNVMSGFGSSARQLQFVENQAAKSYWDSMKSEADAKQSILLGQVADEQAQKLSLENQILHETLPDQIDQVRAGSASAKSQSLTDKLISDLTALKIPAAKAEAVIDTTTYGQAMRYVDRFMRSLLGGSQSAKSLSEIRR